MTALKTGSLTYLCHFFLTQMVQLISDPAKWSIWLEGTVPLQSPAVINGVHMPGAACRAGLILSVNNWLPLHKHLCQAFLKKSNTAPLLFYN